MFRYDPRNNSWCPMASLNEKRTFFHLSAIDENLYAVGGRNSQGELATVEKYFAKEDQVRKIFSSLATKVASVLVAICM